MAPVPDLLLRDVRLPGGRIVDISIRAGMVVHAGSGYSAREEVRCRGMLALPGGVDMHVHMRGRSQSAKEDWRTGTMSAIAGGVTVVVDQPNTVPPLVTRESFLSRVREASYMAVCGFGINGGVGHGADLMALWEAGALCYGEIFAGPSSYGDAVPDRLLSRSLGQIGRIGGLATIHAEAPLPGLSTDLAEHDRIRPAVTEADAVRRILGLNHGRARLHFCHMSSAAAIDAAEGTVEVAPHHLLLSRDRLPAGETHGKVNPPLRTERERRALWTRWDRIDVIASDHAPHTRQEKEGSFASAPSGIPGVETMIPLLLKEALDGRCTVGSLVEKISDTPSRICGIPRAGMRAGCRADIALYPPDPAPVVPEELASRAGWTPYEGMDAFFPEIVIRDGSLAYHSGEFIPTIPRWYPGRGYIDKSPI